MGHVRLGTLPRTRAWKDLIALIEDGADLPEIADATVRASDKAFEAIQNDSGFADAVDLMTHLAIAVYEFTFEPARGAPAFQRYLSFADQDCNSRQPEAVVMFSGGLDSLGGVVDEVLEQRNDVVLVTHKSTQKNNRILRDLTGKIAAKAPHTGLQHLDVRVHKHHCKNTAREHTQRSRSFLFASIGATVAKMLGLDVVRFYENGVVSLNLPICAQVVGGKATRTTHPRVINGFQRLFSLLNDAPFTVENPFLWKTKGEVIQQIIKSDHADLIESSISCAHTWQRSNEWPHCGTCSQCIDRRIAIVAVGAEEFDPPSHYKVDIFTGKREREDDKIMLASYLERANRVCRIQNVPSFIATYPEVVRAIEAIGGNHSAIAERLLRLYRRHADEVHRAVETVLSRHAGDLYKRTLPGDCLIKIVTESRSTTTVPAVEVREVTTSGPSTSAISKQIADGFESIRKERIIDAIEGKELKEELGEIAGRGDQYFHGLLAGFGGDSASANTFSLLVTRDPEGGGRMLSYEEIGKRLGITKQAVSARVKKMARGFPPAHRYVEQVRKVAETSLFSELGPSRRRKAGVDDAYGFESS